MKKKWILIMGSCVLTVILIFVIKYAITRSIEVQIDNLGLTILDENDVKEKDFLNDKSIAVFFSMTIDQNMFGKGSGLVTFVDDKGDASFLKTNRLEVGTLASHNKNLLVSDSEKLLLLGEQSKKFDLENDQHTGEQSGYLHKNNIFYTIFNSGFTSDGGYGSDIYWIYDNELHNDVLPYFIKSSGQGDDHIYTIYEGEKSIRLDKVSLNKEMTYENLTSWGEYTYFRYFSNIVADKNFIYFVATKRNKTYLVQMDKQTFEREDFFIDEFESSEDQSAKTPFMTSENLYKYDNNLYYVDGLGHVYKFNTSEKTAEPFFQFLEYEKASPNSLHEELVDISNNFMYFFRFNTGKDEYTLEKYNLDNGERVSQQILPDIKIYLENIQKGGLGTYDISILE